jgi:hypothetical protein
MGKGDEIRADESAQQVEAVETLEALAEKEACPGNGEQWLELL